MPLLLHNAALALQHGLERGSLLVSGGRIKSVFTDTPPAGLSAKQKIDVQGAILSPGLIDIHIHGSAGFDTMTADCDELSELSRFLLAQGVTGYCPTLVPAEEDECRAAALRIDRFARQQREAKGQALAALGARILGIHYEGPFLNRNRCGALKSRLFKTYDGDPRSLESLGVGKRTPVPRLMTLAPEIDGGYALMPELKLRGVRPFIGHSRADLETLDRAAHLGASHITHFPNALDPFHHREPGALGWGLTREDVSLDCIADYHHVHPLTLGLLYKTKGAGRMALISDAIKPAGLGDGEYEVWGETVRVVDGKTSLARDTGEGALAGSVINLREAVKNILRIGVPVHEALHMAALVPALAAGIDREYGSIQAGKRADLVVFDEGLNLRMAITGGIVSVDRR